MTLKQYVEHLKKLARAYGDCTHLTGVINVVYASDDEGNGYHEVYYAPSAVTVLRDAVTMLLNSPDLNLDDLEEDTIQAINNAHKAMKLTRDNCNILKGVPTICVRE